MFFARFFAFTTTIDFSFEYGITQKYATMILFISTCSSYFVIILL